MRATGIVRRIDDLGRVVIPKEIRRTMRIREGDPLEIYTGSDGDVIFKKYSPIEELSDLAESCAEVIAKIGSAPVAICDRERIVAVSGTPNKRELLELRVSKSLESAMESRHLCAAEGGRGIAIAEGAPFVAMATAPILSAGDVMGCVMILKKSESDLAPSDSELKLAAAAAGFLGKQTEG